MIRKRWAITCIVLAVLVVAVPWIVSVYLPRSTVYNLTRSPGLWQNEIAVNIWFVSAILIFIAALLQFPFKEEEAWTCNCGYDLSFLTPESKHCPECGTTLQLEWTASQGQYSRKTTWRIRLTILLFVLTGVLLCMGVIAKWMIKIANA